VGISKSIGSIEVSDKIISEIFIGKKKEQALSSGVCG
jgi:hypothetical protein